MNEITQLSVICTHVTHDTNGKAKEIKRRFNNINTRLLKQTSNHL